MKLTFLGAAHEVTGSCALLEACGKRFLIDCGMEQGADIYENQPIPVAPGEIDCIFLTHAHIDHSGKLPLLAAGGFGGPIYTTEATEKLCGIMLRDSAHIQEQEAQWRNRRAKRSGGDRYTPLYTVEDAAKTMTLFHGCSYHKEYDIVPGIRARFLDAGHLLGSASVELTVTEGNVTKILLFSGDVGNVARPLIRDPEKPERADIVVIESTYGDRVHGPRKDYVTQLTQVLQTTFDQGGNVVIPAFAVGRTQEFLYLLQEIKEKGLVQGHPDFPVWLDSPLAIEATKIYFGDMMEYYDEEMLARIKDGADFMGFPGLHLAVTSDESVAINLDKTPKVILSASGMCEAGRIRHHLKHNLWRRESTILFVGYQAEGTLGRILTDGVPKVKLFGEEILVNAHIATMDGISGHADRDQLLAWLGNLKTPPEQVFVNHGDDLVTDAFAGTIQETLHYKAAAPYNGGQYDLVTGACLAEGNRQHLAKYNPKLQRSSAAFEKLVQAGHRLMAVIEKCRGGSNKDLGKFTSQISELEEKWK